MLNLAFCGIIIAMSELGATNAISIAESLRNTALETGEVSDKLAALDAAAVANDTVEGSDIGAQTVQAFVDEWNGFEDSRILERSRYEPRYIRPFEEVEDDADAIDVSWIGEDFVRVYGAVMNALGTQAGITITKPRNLEEYYEASLEVSGAAMHRPTAVPPEHNALYMEHEGASVLREDCSVPGTYYIGDAVQAVFFNVAEVRRRRARAEHDSAMKNRPVQPDLASDEELNTLRQVALLAVRKIEPDARSTQKLEITIGDSPKEDLKIERVNGGEANKIETVVTYDNGADLAYVVMSETVESEARYFIGRGRYVTRSKELSSEAAELLTSKIVEAAGLSPRDDYSVEE